MKKYIFAIFCSLSWTSLRAQESETAYNFLRVPVSAHATAVGGNNITIVEDDASLIFSNPALLTNVSHKSLGLNYMNYLVGSNTMSSSFAYEVMERGTVAASAQFIDYGTMKETTAEGVETGTFHARDIAIAAHFSYLLTDHLSAGITGRFVTSYIAGYNSIGLGVDLGVNYYSGESEWSLSAVARNLGGQVKAYADEHERMPLELQCGISKRFVGSPIRLHATFAGLNKIRNTKFSDHLCLGMDILFTQSIWAGIGYNFRKSNEMKFGYSATNDTKDSSHAAGLTLGAGLNLERFKVNLAWVKYHSASSSLMANLAYVF